MTAKRKILIVDDQPVISLAMDMILKQSIPDIEIEQVEGGEKALEHLQDKKYDLVLLDVNLPHYTIFDLIPAILKIQDDAKILVFTATPELELVKKLSTLNVKGFIGKRVSKTETITAVKTVLNGGRYFSKSFID